MAKALDSEVETLLLSLLLDYNIPKPTHSGPPFPPLHMDVASRALLAMLARFRGSGSWVLQMLPEP